MRVSVCWLLVLLTGLAYGQYNRPSWSRGGWGPPLTQAHRVQSRPSIMRMTSSREECGKLGNNVAQRIIGGEVVVPGEFPWLALLQYDRNNKLSFQCGGVLINKRYVLTAAHCTKTSDIKPYKLVAVRLGEHDVSKELDCNMNGDGNSDAKCADPPRNFGFEETVEHEDYVSKVRNDIALVRLDADAPYTNFIRPICLPMERTSRANAGMTLLVAGWGRTGEGTKSNELRKVPLPLVDGDVCFMNSKVKVLDSQICAGGEQGKDSCHGDSGGPLMGVDASNVDNRYEVFGIVSFGSKFCGQANRPGVYTRVSSFVNWLKSKMKP